MSKKKIKIAVDFMSDFPANIVEAVNNASLYSGGEKIILVGPEHARQNLRNGARFRKAEDFFEMGEKIWNIRSKKNASIGIALEMLKSKNAQAVVSAGNSAATVAAAINILGRVPNIERPAIASPIPIKGNRKIILADVGASVDAKPEWMLDWAVLCSIYASSILDSGSETANPRVALLSIGAEKNKGNKLVKECYPLFEECPKINFTGNIENIFSGEADVVICDGFVGNVLLKNLEGGFSCFNSGKKETDYAFYGGALLLGVNGVVVIAHGRSSPEAIENAINLAVASAEKKVIWNIVKKFRDKKK